MMDVYPHVREETEAQGHLYFLMPQLRPSLLLQVLLPVCCQAHFLTCYFGCGIIACDSGSLLYVQAQYSWVQHTLIISHDRGGRWWSQEAGSPRGLGEGWRQHRCNLKTVRNSDMPLRRVRLTYKVASNNHLLSVILARHCIVHEGLSGQERQMCKSILVISKVHMLHTHENAHK